MLVLWYGGSLVNKHELDVGILTGTACNSYFYHVTVTVVTCDLF